MGNERAFYNQKEPHLLEIAVAEVGSMSEDFELSLFI